MEEDEKMTSRKLFITADAYVPDMDIDTYHKRVRGIHPITGRDEPVIGKSSLTTFSRSPAHFDAARRFPKAPTPRMQEGTAGHTCLLEPELFEAEHKQWLDTHCVKRKFSGKGSVAARKEWEEENAHLTILTEDQYYKVVRKHEKWLRMRDCVLAHSEVAEILSAKDGVAEHSFFSLGLEMVWLKARPDWLMRDAGLYYDIKFTADARRHVFRSVASRLKYHWHVLYQDVIEAVTGDRPEMFFMVVEFEYPHCPKIYPIDAEASGIAQDQYRSALRKLRKCLDSGIWPGYESVTEEEPLGFNRSALWINDDDEHGSAEHDGYDPGADDGYYNDEDDETDDAAWEVAA